MKIWKFILFSFPLFALAKTTTQIFLSFPPLFPANEEIEVRVKISNLKNVPYDLKISIEKEKFLSEIYNEKEKKWQSSLYYLKNLFSGPYFERSFKLRVKREYLNFEGEAEIIVRVRQSGKSTFSEKREKIKIAKAKIPEENVLKKEISASLLENVEESSPLSPFLVALSLSFLFSFFFYSLKKRLIK